MNTLVSFSHRLWGQISRATTHLANVRDLRQLGRNVLLRHLTTQLQFLAKIIFSQGMIRTYSTLTTN